MRYFTHFAWAFFFILASCEQSTSKPALVWQEIAGRDNQPESGAIIRYPLYRIKIPQEWQRVDPEPHQSIADTTLPLVTYLIKTPDGEIKFTVHHFPPLTSKKGIPPLAQVNRWKGQFDELEATHNSLEPQAFSGFVGWKFDAEGLLHESATAMLAWALELSPEHGTKIIPFGTAEERRYSLQIKADVTLKFVGPASAVALQRKVLINAARTFELIPDLEGMP